LGHDLLVERPHRRHFWETAREVVVEVRGPEPPRELVEAILQRLGCVLVEGRKKTVRGLLPGDGLHWGQELEVRIRRDRLLVRSSFSATQLFFGGGKNEENLSRFRFEWERRAEYETALADPIGRLGLKVREQDSARRMATGGWVAIGLGAALALALLIIPSREGAPPGGKLRILPFALLALGYGIPRVLTASKRSRD
jgi:hypothetical protein